MNAKVSAVLSEDNSRLISVSNIITELDDGFLKLTGFSKDDIINKDISEIFINKLRLPESKFKQINLKGKIEGFIFTKSLEMREVTISTSLTSMLNEEKYIIIEKPNSRLEDKFSYFEQLYLDGKTGIAIYSADLILLKANQTYLNILEGPDNTKENCIGKSINEIFKGLSGINVVNRWERIINTGEVYCESELAFKNFNGGITYWDTTNVPIFEKGKIKYLMNNSQDVTEKVFNRQKIEEQNNIIKHQNIYLMHQNAKLNAIIENMSDGISIFNRNGKYISINEAAREVFFPEYDNMDTTDDIHYQAEYYDSNENRISHENMPSYRIMRGEKFSGMRIILKFPNKKLYIDVSGTPIYDNNGKFILGIICSHDITALMQNQIDIKAQQEQLLIVEKEKNETLGKTIEMKDEFLSLISHEFKTPLTVINSAIQTMELVCKNELSYKAKGFLNKILQNSNRQLKLVNNLLDITSVHTGHLKINKANTDIVHLTKSITEAITIFAEQKNISLSFSSTLKKKVISIDEEKYERILLNLLSNAIKFTPEGKSISVKVSQKIVKGKSKVSIQVTDKGIGIPSDKKLLIFEKFGQVDSSLTRQSEGTGIGLSLVKMLVEMLDGEITLESEEGMGSTFTIIFPIEVIKGTPMEQMLKIISDNRLIQASVIEFSDIYMK